MFVSMKSIVPLPDSKSHRLHYTFYYKSNGQNVLAMVILAASYGSPLYDWSFSNDATYWPFSIFIRDTCDGSTLNSNQYQYRVMYIKECGKCSH